MMSASCRLLASQIELRRRVGAKCSDYRDELVELPVIVLVEIFGS